MNAGLLVRSATVDDAAAIARIYNQGIEDRVATFETEPRTEAQIVEQLRGRLDTYPAVVAARDGEVVGFAWTSVYRPRSCYAGVGEFSVYVARESRGGGVGRALLDGLATAARDGGFWKLVSRVFPENAASRALCLACGFREVGVYRRHGQLDGVWRDVVIVERLLFDDTPDAARVARVAHRRRPAGRLLRADGLSRGRRPQR